MKNFALGCITRHATSATPNPDPSAVYVDGRPRFEYRMPDGSVVRVIHDHDETPKARIDFTLKGGRIVMATLVTP